MSSDRWWQHFGIHCPLPIGILPPFVVTVVDGRGEGQLTQFEKDPFCDPQCLVLKKELVFPKCNIFAGVDPHTCVTDWSHFQSPQESSQKPTLLSSLPQTPCPLQACNKSMGKVAH